MYYLSEAYNNITIDNNSEDFIDKIMVENMWTREYTIRVIREYKKFIYLSLYRNVAPSRPVDMVWHAHILNSKDYKKMCKTIGRDIQHNPNKKSEIRSTKSVDEYKLTKTFYKNMFEIDPPKDIWTDFDPKSNYVTVDLSKNWLIPRGDYKTLIRLLFKKLFHV